MENKKDFGLEAKSVRMDQRVLQVLSESVGEVLNEGRDALSWCYDMLESGCISLEESARYLEGLHGISIALPPDPEIYDDCVSGAANMESVSPDFFGELQPIYPAYKTDLRGAYPCQLPDSFLGIAHEKLLKRRNNVFNELNMHCEKRHSEMNMSPIAVAVSLASEVCARYLKHLKRRATPWERTVIQTFFMEQEVQTFYETCQYVMTEDSGRCKAICLDVDECQELKAVR